LAKEKIEMKLDKYLTESMQSVDEMRIRKALRSLEREMIDCHDEVEKFVRKAEGTNFNMKRFGKKITEKWMEMHERMRDFQEEVDSALAGYDSEE
jgi:hypothetical protein